MGAGEPGQSGDGSWPKRAGAFLGVMAVSGVAAWLGLLGLGALLQAGDLGAALSAARGEMVGPALLAVVAGLVTLERWRPAVRRPLASRAHLVDAAYLALFALVVAPVLTLVETGFAVELERHAAFLLLDGLPAVPRVAAVVLALVGIDAMNWLSHVANHRSASLWRLHALHHSQEDMSVLTTFRTHPLVHASYLPALLPALCLLGARGGVPVAAVVVYGCMVTLPHANLRWTFGPLGRLLVSPAYHRLHHSAELDALGAVNLGFVLTVWDVLARRAVFPDRFADPVATGILGRPVPLEQSVPGRGADGARGLALVFLAQLAQPFRLRPPAERPPLAAARPTGADR